LLAFQIFFLSLHPKSNFKDMGQKEDIAKTENKIIVIRDKQVILDRDVAELYGVETRRINEALKKKLQLAFENAQDGIQP
jgi:hypothetical protein